MRRLVAAVALALTAAFASLTATAQPIADPAGAGLPVIVIGGDNVVATYLGNSALYSNDLYLVRPGTSDLFLFNNQSSAVGSTVDLGTFLPGTELVFRMHVNNTGNDFFSGPAMRNPDDHAHAAVQSDYGTPGTTLVSFEDIFGGPFNYNDLSFSFSGTVAGTGLPEPATWAMLILGVGATGAMLRRRRATSAAFA